MQNLKLLWIILVLKTIKNKLYENEDIYHINFPDIVLIKIAVLILFYICYIYSKSLF